VAYVLLEVLLPLVPLEICTALVPLKVLTTLLRVCQLGNELMSAVLLIPQRRRGCGAMTLALWIVAGELCQATSRGGVEGGVVVDDNCGTMVVA
jgi:hypothetical protein